MWFSFFRPTVSHRASSESPLLFSVAQGYVFQIYVVSHGSLQATLTLTTTRWLGSVVVGRRTRN